jgi:hypothetical protein
MLFCRCDGRQARLMDLSVRFRYSTETRRIDVQSRVGVRLKGDHRLVDIARRMRQLAGRQIAAATPAVRHAWVEWLGERDAEVLLLTLMHFIEQGERLESLQQIVDGWRTNALRALAAEDYRADVDTYLVAGAKFG